VYKILIFSVFASAARLITFSWQKLFGMVAGGSEILLLLTILSF